MDTWELIPWQHGYLVQWGGEIQSLGTYTVVQTPYGSLLLLDEAIELRDSVGMITRPSGERLGLAGYGAAAGIGASFAGAWASSGLTGWTRTGVWMGVTVVAALIAASVADRVVSVIGWLLRFGLNRMPASR
jgi:hypothetical protein